MLRKETERIRKCAMPGACAVHAFASLHNPPGLTYARESFRWSAWMSHDPTTCHKEKVGRFHSPISLLDRSRPLAGRESRHDSIIHIAERRQAVLGALNHFVIALSELTP